MCEFKNACFVHKSGCEEPCSEKNRLERLKNEKCPIMVACGGYTDEICGCDLPFWLRVLIPHNIACVAKGQCIMAIYFPETRLKACNGKLKLNRDEITDLASMMNLRIRNNAPQRPALSTA